MLLCSLFWTIFTLHCNMSKINESGIRSSISTLKQGSRRSRPAPVVQPCGFLTVFQSDRPRLDVEEFVAIESSLEAKISGWAFPSWTFNTITTILLNLSQLGRWFSTSIQVNWWRVKVQRPKWPSWSSEWEHELLRSSCTLELPRWCWCV